MILKYPHRLLIDYEFVEKLTNGDIAVKELESMNAFKICLNIHSQF